MSKVLISIGFERVGEPQDSTVQIDSSTCEIVLPQKLYPAELNLVNSIVQLLKDNKHTWPIRRKQIA